MKTFFLKFLILSLSFFTLLIWTANAEISSRIKDLITIKGVRKNPLIGHGIVVGLNGTGDGESELKDKSVKSLFKKMGLNLKNEIESKNIASVLVTATLPEFGRIGSKIDVKVSSIGDAKSLAGGTLVITPLKGGDSKIYAIASGSISVGGLSQGETFGTTGLITNGAIVEREIQSNFSKKSNIRLNITNPDFTTASRITETLNNELGGIYAKAKDPSTVDLIVPPIYKDKVVKLVSIIENFKVVSDTRAKIVINERTGTIVAGGDVILHPVAISHGDLSIQIGGALEQNASPRSIYNIEKAAKLKDFVESLNSFGVKPEDIISIFQALKKNGSLVGEIILI